MSSLPEAISVPHIPKAYPSLIPGPRITPVSPQIASLESEAGSTLPPVLQRYRGRADNGAMTKTHSISSIGRRSSVETEV
ncbi:hypothetical protein E2C01_008181 [Portunus trituberculatus]|uniref:Uncharacterized protein n=1 Tax=Portunus trituberculatus TaxID=210409 RepID=A0A5B7D2F6_PORTR|nr:hypothetical protein [Portunus trituberculatus]